MCTLLLIAIQQFAARRSPAHHLRAISQRLFGVESTRRAGHALGYYFSRFVDEDGHKI